MTGFEVFYALLKAIPALRDLYLRWSAEFIAREIHNMKDANRDGIRKALDEHDQRSLEKAIGSTKEGQPSGLAGSSFHDTLPGT